jgi:hypothetical protein
MELITRVLESKAAYLQARRELAAYAAANWIGKRVTVDKPGFSVTATIARVTPAGRVHLTLGKSFVYDIEDVRLLEQ